MTKKTLALIVIMFSMLFVISCVNANVDSNTEVERNLQQNNPPVNLEWNQALRARIEQDFYLANEQGRTLVLDEYDKFYGIHNNTAVFFVAGFSRVITLIEVAGVEFWWGSLFTIVVWSDGCFYHIADAYEKGILTSDNIQEMSRIHADRGWGRSNFNS